MPNWTKEQSSAINESGSNIIVSAGAGSGKTAVLSERVIRILKEGTHIDELLILTFTKAAANEMKDRIRSNIKENPSLKDELELIDAAYITTFDSFALSVVKKYHYLLNISSDITITDGSIINLQKKEIMNNVFDEYYEKDNAKFNNLIKTFCVKDDKSLIKSLLKIADSLELLPDKNTYLSTYLTQFYTEDYIDNLIAEFFQLLKSKVTEITIAIDNFKPLISNEYYHSLVDSLISVKYADSLDNLVAASNVKLPSVPKNSLEEVKIYKEKNIMPLVKEFKRLADFGSTATIKANILSTKETMSIIIELLTVYFQKLADYKTTNEIYDFQDIALLAIKIVKDYPIARNELKNKFKEIMIDEYQDTNDIQETFINLIANNNTYMVGDIKQSIYRFRNANPYIFKNKYDQYSRAINGKKIDLLKNFRSRNEVLNNINLIFNQIMDDMIGGANYIATHQMVFGNTAYDENIGQNQNYNLQVLTYDQDEEFTSEEIEIFAIARDIQNKLANNYQVYDKDKKVLRKSTYQDFVILMDRATSFDLYKKVFEYLNIPLALYKDENLIDSDEILVIKNALTLTNQIANKNYDVIFRYSLTSLARSFLFEISDAEIFTWFQNNDFYHNPVFTCFESLAKETINLNTKQILEQILDKTDYYAKLIKIGDINSNITRISKLLEFAEALANSGYTIEDFVTYLDTISKEDEKLKYPNNLASEEAVRIMTIHKSKGLEFPICYFSGLFKKFNITEIKDKFVYNSQYGLVVPAFKEGIAELITKELVKNNYNQEEISEKIRLLYVGLTRAKESMIILLPKDKKENPIGTSNTIVNYLTRIKYRSFADILYSISSSLKPYTSSISIPNLKLTKDYLYPKTYNSYQSKEAAILKVKEISIPNEEIISNNFSKKIKSPITKETKNNIELGLKMHSILEYIDFLNYDPNSIPDEFIRHKVTNFINNPLLANIKEANIYHEYEFIYEEDEQKFHGIIDLLLEYSDHCDIIDYKLNNIEDAKYLEQLKGYQKYIAKITNKPVNIYLYSLINNEMKKL